MHYANTSQLKLMAEVGNMETQGGLKVFVVSFSSTSFPFFFFSFYFFFFSKWFQAAGVEGRHFHLSPIIINGGSWSWYNADQTSPKKERPSAFLSQCSQPNHKSINRVNIASRRSTVAQSHSFQAFCLQQKRLSAQEYLLKDGKKKKKL